MTAPWYSRRNATPLVMMGSLTLRGGRFIRPDVGLPKPRATPMGPSTNQLIHRIWMGPKGTPPAIWKKPAARKLSMKPTSVAIWKRMNLSRLSYSARPKETAWTMVAKLSSVRIMSAAPLETSVPVMPIATPMSAFFSAGASLTPSPVMATTSSCSCSRRTSRTLSSGATRAMTLISSNSCFS